MTSRRAALLAAAALFAARDAAAAPPTHPVAEALQVEPNRCFDAASLSPVLARWLHRDAIDRRLAVEIAGQPGGPEGLTIRVRRDGEIVGERHFPALSGPCDEVRAAVGLAAAIAIDATVLESLGVKPDVAPAPPPQPTPSRWPGFAGSFDAGLLFGVLPSPTAAFAPTFGVRLVTPIELRFSALISTASTLSLDLRSIDVALLAGRADVCAAISGKLVRGRACIGLAAGRLQATPSGPNTSPPSSPPWAAALARADVRLSLSSWFGFVVGADAIFPFTHPRFEVVTSTGAPVASSSLPVVGGAVSIGPEITFR
jgi:hypothetical protein